MNIKRTSVLALTAIAMSMPMTGYAAAQSATPPAAGQQAPAQDFSDETLRSFAVAFLEVDQINRDYSPRLQEATSPEEQQEIQREASQEMVSAVEGTDGISVQEYTSIMQAAQANPELAEQLSTYIGEASGGQPAQ